jgi:SAM-dependent methyltransferase
MVFLCPQHQHDLIPQNADPQIAQDLGQALQAGRGQLFQLLQERSTAAQERHAETSDSEELYRHVRADLDADPEVQAVNQQRGELQDRMWATAAAAIQGDRARLEQVYRSHQTGAGALALNPVLDVPKHQRQCEIHRMPGGYLQDLATDPFGSGALYDHGVFLYGRGWLGPLNDELGQTLIHHVLRSHYPDFQPRRILDMGCSVGHSTLPYRAAYPEADIWGIDLGAGLLRYAITRSRVLQQPVNFAQHNAEQTDFAANSFDLVVSHILLHELPTEARQRVFAESDRLLKPGGLMVHLESQLFLQPPSLAGRYFRDTEVWANNEPYLGSLAQTDFGALAERAGFDPAAFVIHTVPGYYAAQNGNPKPGWAALCAQK